MSSVEFRDLFSSDHVDLVFSGYQIGESKTEFLAHLLDRCLEGTEMLEKRDNILESLIGRENSMSTGVGLGIAVPHCSSDDVKHVCTHVAVLKEGINFEAIDDEPVRIIVLLLFPRAKVERHIKLLSLIARVLNDQKIRDEILEAKDTDQIHNIITCAMSD